MNETFRTLILYSKHWYERKTKYAPHDTVQRAEQVIEDLQYILTELYDYEYNREDVWSMVLDCFLTFCSPSAQRRLFLEMFRTNEMFSHFSNHAEYHWVVYRAICQLGILQVKDNPQLDGLLGKPDYKQFPLLNAKEEVAKEFFK